MKSNSPRQLIDKIRRLERQRRDTLEQLLTDEPLLSGSLSEVERKCGKPSCYCAEGERGHPQLQVVFTERDRRRCRTIRNADADRVRRWADRARRFRDAVAALKAIHNDQIGLLDGLKEARRKIYDPRN